MQKFLGESIAPSSNFLDFRYGREKSYSIYLCVSHQKARKETEGVRKDKSISKILSKIFI